jgi:hypothetical protein
MEHLQEWLAGRRRVRLPARETLPAAAGTAIEETESEA